MLKTLLRNQL